MMQERLIQEDRIIRTVTEPDWIEERRDDERHFLKQIPENRGKFLRVVVNPSRSPARVITVFFDRRIQP